MRDFVWINDEFSSSEILTSDLLSLRLKVEFFSKIYDSEMLQSIYIHELSLAVAVATVDISFLHDIMQ